MPEILRVGGLQYNWNSTVSRIDGAMWQGLTSVDWGEKLDVETVYSQTQNGVPLGDTGGQYSIESFNIKMLREYAEQLLDYLANDAPGIGGERGDFGTYGQTKFHFQLTVSEDSLPNARPIHVDAVPCRVINAKPAHAKGPGALEMDLSLWCQQITVNGRTMYAASPSLLR